TAGALLRAPRGHAPPRDPRRDHANRDRATGSASSDRPARWSDGRCRHRVRGAVRRGEAVKFGIPLGALNPAVWLDVTVAADELGFDSVWMPEHLVLPVTMGGSPH